MKLTTWNLHPGGTAARCRALPYRHVTHGAMTAAVLTAAGGCGAGGSVRSSSVVTVAGPTTTSPFTATLPTAPSTTAGLSTLVGSPTTPQPTTPQPTTAQPTTSVIGHATTTAVAGSAYSNVAKSGGLTVTLTVSPAPFVSGATVQFSIAADETAARGALGYRLSYGDGTSDQNIVAQYCLGGAGTPQSQHWNLTHRYATAGHYAASVTVTVACTDRATATVPVVIT